MGDSYRYVIVGGGLAGASAVDGIREVDKDGSILLLCRESHLPYHRPPLSKGLWTGKKKVGDIFVHDERTYRDQQVDVQLGTVAAELDPAEHRLTDSNGRTIRYEKLLLATGCTPRMLDVPGRDLGCYFRTLDDYLHSRETADGGGSAVVIGGGFIGSEMAAALHQIGVKVTMVFPGHALADRVLPEPVARAVQDDYVRRGVTVLAGDKPTALAKSGNHLQVTTAGGRELQADQVIVGIGVTPNTSLAMGARLDVEDGIVVDEFLQTSHADVYAAGDNAFFPYAALGRRMRVEHWDNAQAQGRHAGRNMAGAAEPYTYMPYFFSDLFDFGYEAVGEVDARLETRAHWEDENRKGTIYYVRDGKIRGALMCNVWDKVEAARQLIRSGQRIEEVLAG